jgi:hypothetical protein
VKDWLCITQVHAECRQLKDPVIAAARSLTNRQAARTRVSAYFGYCLEVCQPRSEYL